MHLKGKFVTGCHQLDTFRAVCRQQLVQSCLVQHKLQLLTKPLCRQFSDPSCVLLPRRASTAATLHAASRRRRSRRSAWTSSATGRPSWRESWAWWGSSTSSTASRTTRWGRRQAFRSAWAGSCPLRPCRLFLVSIACWKSAIHVGLSSPAGNLHALIILFKCFVDCVPAVFCGAKEPAGQRICEILQSLLLATC